MLALALVEVRRAFEGEVGGLGGAGSPDDFARISANEVGHMTARLFNGGLGFPALGVAAAGGVAKVFVEPGHHGVHYARVARRGGAVVKVNGVFLWGVVHGVSGLSFGMEINVSMIAGLPDIVGVMDLAFANDAD